MHRATVSHPALRALAGLITALLVGAAPASAESPSGCTTSGVPRLRIR